MGKIAFLFPGQGAQYIGMGKDLVEISPAAASVFQAADRIKPGLSHLCFEGSEEALRRTENTQPCLYTMEMACAAVLRERGLKADLVGGFSLGELSAMSYSGCAVFEIGLSIVCRRAALMQNAAEQNPASMAAVLRLDTETVENLCTRFDGVYPVNYNAPGQIAVAVAETAFADFSIAVKEAGGRSIPLKVSGGFHSPFMQKAASAFREELEAFPLQNPSIPLYANETASLYEGNLRDRLASQISHPVRFEDQVRAMAEAGTELFLEVGPGTVLRGLISKILPEARVLSFGKADDLSVLKTEGVLL